MWKSICGFAQISQKDSANMFYNNAIQSHRVKFISWGVPFHQDKTFNMFVKIDPFSAHGDPFYAQVIRLKHKFCFWRTPFLRVF